MPNWKKITPIPPPQKKYYTVKLWTMFKEMFSKNYSQAKTDVLRISKRQSFESPMMGSLKLSPLMSASTQTRLISQLQLGTFIPSAGLCQGTGRHRQCKVHPTLPCGGTKAKGLKGYSWLKAQNYKMNNSVKSSKSFYCIKDAFYGYLNASRTLERICWLID